MSAVSYYRNTQSFPRIDKHCPRHCSLKCWLTGQVICLNTVHAKQIPISSSHCSYPLIEQARDMKITGKNVLWSCSTSSDDDNWSCNANNNQLLWWPCAKINIYDQRCKSFSWINPLFLQTWKLAVLPVILHDSSWCLHLEEICSHWRNDNFDQFHITIGLLAHRTALWDTVVVDQEKSFSLIHMFQSYMIPAEYSIDVR